MTKREFLRLVAEAQRPPRHPGAVRLASKARVRHRTKEPKS